MKEYAAHLIPEGGYKAIPQLYGDGWVVVGDAAQLNNAIHREGSNLAMTSGRLAAEAIFQIKSRRDPMTAENLALYKNMLDKSFVMKDLKKYKDMPALLHTQAQNFFLTYPQLVSKAMQNFVRVDGTPKSRKRKDHAQIVRRGALAGSVSSATRSASRGHGDKPTMAIDLKTSNSEMEI